MEEVQDSLPFGVAMVIISLYARGGLLKTDVVEACEGGPIDVFDGVVGHEEVLFPPHEDEIRLV